MSSFPKVSPGDPWRPNAAKENALTDLLNRFSAGGNTILPGAHYASSEYLKVCNVSETNIEKGQAVQLDTYFVPDDTYRLSPRNVHACGKPVENEMGFWGVALDNIQPGEGGPVQVSGITLIRNPEGLYHTADPGMNRVRNNFIFPGRDGKYHFGQWGGAEIIWYDDITGYTLIRLGAPNYQYTGMFAVLDNFDGTLTVKGGVTDLGSYNTEYSAVGGAFIEDTVIPVMDHGAAVTLAASRKEDWTDGWVLEIVQDDVRGRFSYIPGQKISWTLAAYDGREEYGHAKNLRQLWQGGCVNFRDRYFIR